MVEELDMESLRPGSVVGASERRVKEVMADGRRSKHEIQTEENTDGGKSVQ